jgi:hypothetical protein
MNNSKTTIEISFQSGGETLVGDLILPPGPGPHPALLMVAGTGSQDRYGTIYFPSKKIGKRFLRRWLSERLAEEGIASLIWDKRGVGASTGGDRKPGDLPGDRDLHASVSTDVEDSHNAFRFLQQRPEIAADRIAVMGHSAGVYFSCLLAKETDAPAGYVFLGGVHEDIRDFMSKIYGRLEAYIASSPERASWVLETLPYEAAYLNHWRGYQEAAEQGEEFYEMVNGEERTKQSTKRLREEIEFPLPDQFKHVRSPTLILHGDQDVNVNVGEAPLIKKALEDGGNSNVSMVIVPGGDHSMNIAPASFDDEQRLRELYLHNSYRHPLSEFFAHALIGWLKDQMAALEGQQTNSGGTDI